MNISKAKEKVLFSEICMAFLMQNGVGINTKSPEYIREKMARKEDSMAIWQSCGFMVKGRIREYCNKWGLPIDKWIAEIEAPGHMTKKLKTGKWTQ
ncbi:MAG: hypothetical protein KAS32_10165 [Candidatus Peribacteraceae bacterium]|nr:hypothetical protein [Candidatus Peribacteraceae bacterium]